MHKHSEHASDHLTNGEARSSERKERCSQEELWVALISHDGCGDTTFLTTAFYFTLRD